MGARGFNVAQEGHVIQIFNPGSISGGVSSSVFSMKYAAKCNIIIGWGALAAAQGAVTLLACTDLTGGTSVAIAFDRFQQTTAGAGNDVLAARQAVTSSGYTPNDVANTIDVLHVQADQLPQGYPCLKLAIADGTNVDLAGVFVIQTGLRYAGESNQSATV